MVDYQLIYRTPSFVLTGLLIVISLLTTGCPQPGRAWGVASYEKGEKLAEQRKTDLAIFYKDVLDDESGKMLLALESPEVRSALNGKVTCAIVPDYKPNRNYIARYGVTMPPALVILHTDGTYHAFKGKGTSEQLATFIKKAVPPGDTPDGDATPPGKSEYKWVGTWKQALEQAKRRNQPILVVYKWWLSAPSSEMLRRISDPDVARQFANMTHCILDWDFVPNRGIMERFGIDKLPAMVIVHRDGTYHALPGLHTKSEIIDWVTGSTPPGKTMRPPKPKGSNQPEK